MGFGRRFSSRRRLKRWALKGVLAGLAFLVLLNGAVRLLGGGEPHLLSPRFVPEKLHALGALAAHAPFHFFRSCGEDRRKQIERAAERRGLPADLVLRVARAESAFESHRISHAGAMGVMQLMPGTAADYGVSDPFDAAENIDGGVRFLRYLWRRYKGDRRRVVAAYNLGPGRVPVRGALQLPSETDIYLTRVFSAR